MRQVFQSTIATNFLVVVEDDRVTIESGTGVPLEVFPGDGMKRFDGGWVEMFPKHATQMFQLEGFRGTAQLKFWREPAMGNSEWCGNGFVLKQVEFEFAIDV